MVSLRGEGGTGRIHSAQIRTPCGGLRRNRLKGNGEQNSIEYDVFNQIA
jgi:hypothetical protein